MKKIYLAFFLYGFFFCSCKDEKEGYLAGEVIIIDGFKKEVTLKGEEVKLDGVYADYMSVYDSLAIFLAYDFPDYQLYLYNLNTGKQLKSLCKKGRGSNEFLNMAHTEQYVVDSNSIKLWAYDEKKSHMLINLTRSLELDSDSLVIDSIILIEAKKVTTSWIGYVFVLDDYKFLTKLQCEKAYYKDVKYIPGKYTLYQNSLDNPQKTLVLFNKPVINRVNKNYAENMFYASSDRVKPDKSKIAMAMAQMAQINILDIATGDLKGFRLKGTPGFDYLTGDPKNFRYYHGDISVDNQYIYALYEGGIKVSKFTINRTNTIVHIYDWNGNGICKLILSEVLKQITLDPVSGFLYGTTGMEEVFKYNVRSVLTEL